MKNSCELKSIMEVKVTTFNQQNIKYTWGGVPLVAQWLMNLTSIHEDVGSTLASFSGLRIWDCSELRCRLPGHGSDATLLWLWCRLAAAAPI